MRTPDHAQGPETRESRHRRHAGAMATPRKLAVNATTADDKEGVADRVDEEVERKAREAAERQRRREEIERKQRAQQKLLEELKASRVRAMASGRRAMIGRRVLLFAGSLTPPAKPSRRTMIPTHGSTTKWRACGQDLNWLMLSDTSPRSLEVSARETAPACAHAHDEKKRRNARRTHAHAHAHARPRRPC